MGPNPNKPRPGWRALLWHYTKLAFSLGLLAYWLQKIDFSELLGGLTRVNHFMILAAFFIVWFSNIFLPAAITHASLVRSSGQVSLGLLLRLNMIIRYYVMVLPRGAAMVMRWHRYQKFEGKSSAVALVIFEKLIQFIVVMTTAVFFLSLEQEKLGDKGGYILGVTALGLTGLLLILLPFLSGRVYAVFYRIYDRLARPFPNGLTGKINKLWEAAAGFQTISRRKISRILFFSLFSYFLSVLAPWVIGLGIGQEWSFIMLAWIRSLITVFLMIPVSVSGIGVRETGFVALMGLYGIEREAALSLSLVLLSFQIVISLAGLVLYLTEPVAPTEEEKSP